MQIQNTQIPAVDDIVLDMEIFEEALEAYQGGKIKIGTYQDPQRNTTHDTIEEVFLDPPTFLLNVGDTIAFNNILMIHQEDGLHNPKIIELMRGVLNRSNIFIGAMRVSLKGANSENPPLSELKLGVLVLCMARLVLNITAKATKKNG